MTTTRPPSAGAFHAWVARWEIGPGMNDRWFAEGRRDIPPPTRYSGYDGTVGDGWIPLLDRLAADLAALGWDRGVQQIKEKFGTLRFYVHTESDEIRRRIHEAEAESTRTCEACGADAPDGPSSGPRGRGWVKTLCTTCWAARG